MKQKKQITIGLIATTIVTVTIISLLLNAGEKRPTKKKIITAGAHPVNQAISFQNKPAATKAKTTGKNSVHPEIGANIEKTNKNRADSSQTGNAQENSITSKYSIYNYKPLNLNRDPNKIDCMIEPYMVVDVASSTSGVVSQVTVDRGSYVRKGQVLARLESGVEKANVEHAAAKYEFSKTKYERMKLLFQKKIIPYLKLEESKTELQLAQHEYKRASELLRMRTIRSPFSGVVVERYISPGELTEQQKILKIARINPLKVEIIAPVKLHGTIKRGMYAEIWPEGPKKGPYKAKVKIIDRVIDAASGTFGVRLLLNNPKHRIPAGVRCQAKFLPMTDKHKNKSAKKKSLSKKISKLQKNKKSRKKWDAKKKGRDEKNKKPVEIQKRSINYNNSI